MSKPLTRPKREPQTISLQDAFAVYFDDCRACRCTHRTLHYYHERLTKFVTWCQANSQRQVDIEQPENSNQHLPANVRSHLWW